MEDKIQKFLRDRHSDYADNRVSISDDETMWFEISLGHQRGSENGHTDILFDMLPEFINIEGKLYHFNISKGKRIIISYQTDKDENGVVEFLGETTRSSDESLKDACRKMVDWLFKFEYVQYMPYGYKKLYEEVFKVKIEHSRGFKE